MIATLTRLADRVLARVLRDVRTGVTGTVQAYDDASGAATILPDIGEQAVVEGATVNADPPVVYGVPVLHVGGSRFSITFRLSVGDRVLLGYRHRSHEEVDGGVGVPVVPAASRRMSASDVIAHTGYTPPVTGIPEDRRRTDGQPVIGYDPGDALHLGSADAELELSRADRTDAQLQEIRDLLTTWVPVASDGGAALKAAALALWTDPSLSVAAERVKVDG